MSTRKYKLCRTADDSVERIVIERTKKTEEKRTDKTEEKTPEELYNFIVSELEVEPKVPTKTYVTDHIVESNYQAPSIIIPQRIEDLYFIDPNDKGWKDKGSYYLNVNEQRSNGWFRARLFRVTTSEFGTPLGVSPYCTPNEYALYLSGLRKKEFYQFEMDRMNHGTRTEDECRFIFCALKNAPGDQCPSRDDESFSRDDISWNDRDSTVPGIITHSRRTTQPGDNQPRGMNDPGGFITVREVGLAVPKDNLFVGGSTDGIVYFDGVKSKYNVEIKCPQRMYKELEDNLQLMNLSSSTRYIENNEPDDYKYVKPIHYAQMQGCIHILNAEACYYIVYDKVRELMCVVLIQRDQEFIDNMMKTITHFVKSKVFPLLEYKRSLSLQDP